MIDKLILLLFAFILGQTVIAQPIDYHESNRRILVNGTDSSNSQITINQDLGYWRFRDTVNVDGNTHVGGLQISDLGSDGLCAKSYAWNFIQGSYPFSADSQNSLITSFSLNTDSTLKIDFSGMGHFNNNADHLIFTPIFFLKSGFTGNGGTLLQINGHGIEYLSLPAGDYRITSAIGTSFNCQNDPNCNLTYTYQSKFKISFENTEVIGSSYTTPFLPDEYEESESQDIEYINSDGAFVIRGYDKTFTYTNQSDGWYDLGDQNKVNIHMHDGKLLTELKLPPNRQGVYKLKVTDVLIGDFYAGDLLVFSDYSAQLGSLLQKGLSNAQGVSGIELIYQPLTNENLTNSCEQVDNLSIKLQFDEALVSFSAVLSYPENIIFSSGFEDIN